MTHSLAKDETLDEMIANSRIRPDTAPVHYVFAAEEDRCAVRYDVSIPAKMRFSCSPSFDVEISDISLAGFSCDALLQIQPGTLCWLTLPGLVGLEAEVVRHDNRGLGCAFAVLLNPAVLDRFIRKYPAKEKAED